MVLESFDPTFSQVGREVRPARIDGRHLVGVATVGLQFSLPSGIDKGRRKGLEDRKNG